MSGNMEKVNLIEGLLKGSCTHQEHQDKMFGDAIHTINYIECHDNYTIWDKLNVCCDEDKNTKRAMQRLGTAITLLSQGIPLLHAGQEFCETKFGDHNSYKSADKANSIDWDRAYEFKDDIDYVAAHIMGSLFRRCTMKYLAMEKEIESP